MYSTNSHNGVGLLAGGKDKWQGMSKAHKEQTVINLIRDGIIAVLNKQANNLEDYIRAAMSDIAKNESWPEWKQNNPTETNWIYDGEKELNQAVKLIAVTINTGDTQSAISRINNSKWKYVDKALVEQMILAGVSTPAELNPTPPPAEETQITTFSISRIGTFIKENPIPVGIAGVGLLIIIGSNLVKPSKKTVLQKPAPGIKAAQMT